MEPAPYCCEALDQFTLVWEQTTAPALPEQTYYLTDQTSAALTLHVAPVSAGSRRYQSAFSLVRTRRS